MQLQPRTYIDRETVKTDERQYWTVCTLTDTHQMDIFWSMLVKYFLVTFSFALPACLMTSLEMFLVSAMLLAR